MLSTSAKAIDGSITRREALVLVCNIVLSRQHNENIFSYIKETNDTLRNPLKFHTKEFYPFLNSCCPK